MNLTRIDMLSPGVLLVLGLCESGMLSSPRQRTPSVVLSIWGMLELLTCSDVASVSFPSGSLPVEFAAIIEQQENILVHSYE